MNPRDYLSLPRLIAITLPLLIAGLLTTSKTSAQNLQSFSLYVTPQEVALRVALEEGFLNGIIDLTPVTVGFGEDDVFFLRDQDAQIGAFAPDETARYVAEGEQIKYVSTAAGIRFVNSVVVRADSDIYRIQDLVGRRLGNPGFGSATWQAFQVAMSTIGIDAPTDFHNIVASPGALLGLLDKGEIDAALLLSGQTFTALANPKFRRIFSLDTFWEEQTGYPLLITGLVIRTPWYERNREVVREINAALDRAVLWMQRNSHEFTWGGKYEHLANEAGWLTSEAGNSLIQKVVRDGRYYAHSGLFTRDWIDATWKFIEAGVGIFIDQLPEKDAVFGSPHAL